MFWAKPLMLHYESVAMHPVAGEVKEDVVCSKLVKHYSCLQEEAKVIM